MTLITTTLVGSRHLQRPITRLPQIPQIPSMTPAIAKVALISLYLHVISGSGLRGKR